MRTHLISFFILLVAFVFGAKAFFVDKLNRKCDSCLAYARDTMRQTNEVKMSSRLNFSPPDSNNENERFISRVCSSSSAREAMQLTDLNSRKWERFVNGEDADNALKHSNANEEIVRSDIELSREAKRFAGFSLLSEILNGRLAMLGLTFGLVNEFVTGKSLMEQIGFATDIPILSISFIISLITLINHTYRSKMQL